MFIYIYILLELLVCPVTVTDVSSFLKASKQLTINKHKKGLVGGCLELVWSTHYSVMYSVIVSGYNKSNERGNKTNANVRV